MAASPALSPVQALRRQRHDRWLAAFTSRLVEGIGAHAQPGAEPIEMMQQSGPGTAPCTLFDRACGVNATAYLLATAGDHLIGTDLGDQPSKQGDLPSGAWSHPDLGSVGGSLHVQTADSPALPFPDARVDGCDSISFLEHRPDSIQAVREMVRMTRPGGLVSLTMDGAPCSSAVANGSQVNRSNFAALEHQLASSTDVFSPPCFVIPDGALSLEKDRQQSSGLRAAARQLRRGQVGQPETPGFHGSGGASSTLT